MRPYAAERAREQVLAALRRAVRAAVDAGALPAEARDAEVRLEVPRDRAHGDYASNIALALARPARRSPREVAEAVRAHLELEGTLIERAEVAGPGFINFFLKRDWLLGVLEDVCGLGEAYGDCDLGRGQRVLVEFVSANPTGPLNVVNARHAALGDSLARVLEAAGYRVDREYYVNDAGGQVERLARSLEARARQRLGQPAEVPADGYHGEYLIPAAEALLREHGPSVLELPEEERLRVLARFAVDRFVREHRETLARFGVRFDRWMHETELRAAGKAEEALRLLRERGFAYEADGAVWLRTTAFGDDKDRVLVKRDGEYTYMMPDIAYHLDKLQRGYDVLVNLLGRDHYGYHVRMAAALAALGYDPSRLEVVYLAMVHLVRGGEAVRMSKRRGEIVPMQELLDEVGVDAARYFFLMRSADTEIDFDVDLAQRQTEENPVYYVQYAHARVAGILRHAREQGVAVPERADGIDPAWLADESEEELLRLIARLPEEVAAAARGREPHRLTYYAYDLATAFHRFYTRCRVLSEPSPVREARLLLCHAAGVALRKALRLLGVSAPERM